MNRLTVKRLHSIGAVESGDNPPAEIVLFKRKVSDDERERLAGRGLALPDGSYPIANIADLRNAIQAFGRAKNKGAVKAHIVRRAKALNQTSLLPDGWNVTKIEDNSTDSAPDGDTDMSGDLDLSALEDELRAEIEKTLAGYEARIAELESHEPEDVTKGLSDEAKALFEALEKKAAEQEAALEKERDARLTAEWIGKARSFEKVLGDAETAAPFLKSLDTGTADWLLEKLASVEKVLERSDLFKEFGSSEDDSTAKDKIDALAKEKLGDNPELTMEQARVLVRKANPDLKRLEREGR